MIGTSKYEIKEVLLDMKSERAFFRAKKVKNKLFHNTNVVCVASIALRASQTLVH